MSKFKTKFYNFLEKANKSSFFISQVKWSFLNFILSLLALIFCVSIIVSSSSSSALVPTILVYAGYLPSVLACIVMTGILTISTIVNNQLNFYKLWWFYLPLVAIFLQIVVLPIPLNMITHAQMNAGILWSILIFAFVALACAIINFLVIYKINLKDLTYVIGGVDDEDEKITSDEQVENTTVSNKSSSTQ